MLNKRFAIALAALLVAAVALSACGSAQNAAQPSAQTPTRTITVVGQGKATGTPDQARINIGVETQAASAQEAMNANRDKMNALLAKLKSLGIADKDMQTSNFSIYTEQRPQSLPVETKGGEGEIVYHVSNQVNIKVREVSKLGDILDQAVSAGANSVYGVYFEVSDTKDLEAQAREKAIADAKSRAEALAKLAGVSVGDVLVISEVITGGPGPIYYDVAKVQGLGGGTSIQPGEYEFSLSVQVTYSIK